MILVAKQPSSQGSSLERQQIMDERLQAIRALRKFRQNDSADALVYVLETEKDVALRHRATESLQVMTGKSLPAEPVAWREALQRENIQTAREPSFIGRNPIRTLSPGLNACGDQPSDASCAVDPPSNDQVYDSPLSLAITR